MSLSTKARALLDLLGSKKESKEIADAIDSGSNIDVAADIAAIESDVSDLSDDVDTLQAAVDAGYPQVATVVLTATQLRKLNATPITLVAAPGANKILVPINVTAKLTAGLNVFDAVGASDDFTVKFTNSSGVIVSQIETVGFLDQASNQFRVAYPGNATVALKEFTPVVNSPLVAHITTGEIAAADDDANGNGTLTVKVSYITVDV